MVYTARQVLTYPQMGVTLKTPPVIPDRVIATTLDSQFENILQTSVSPLAFKHVANDNHALMAELTKRIQNNPRLKELQAASADELSAEPVPAAIDPIQARLAQDALASDPQNDHHVQDIAAQAVDTKPAAVKQVEIELAETVRFLQELRQDPLRSDADLKGFLNFAAQEAAWQRVAPAEMPDATEQSAVADSAYLPNPLALQQLADRFDVILPAVKHRRQTAFQANAAEMTDTQSLITPVMKTELQAIALNSQFDAALIQQANQLLIASPGSPLPPLPQAEKAVLDLISKAKQEKSKIEANKLTDILNSNTYSLPYDLAWYDPKGRKMGYETIKSKDFNVTAQPASSDQTVSLTDPIADPHHVAQNMKNKHTDVVVQTGENMIGAKYQQMGYDICLLNGHNGDMIKSNLNQKQHPSASERDPNTIQQRFTDTAQSVLNTQTYAPYKFALAV